MKTITKKTSNICIVLVNSHLCSSLCMNDDNVQHNQARRPQGGITRPKKAPVCLESIASPVSVVAARKVDARFPLQVLQ